MKIELIISRLLQLIVARRDIIFLSINEMRYNKLRMTLMKVFETFRQGIGHEVICIQMQTMTSAKRGNVREHVLHGNAIFFFFQHMYGSAIENNPFNALLNS